MKGCWRSLSRAAHLPGFGINGRPRKAIPIGVNRWSQDPVGACDTVPDPFGWCVSFEQVETHRKGPQCG